MIQQGSNSVPTARYDWSGTQLGAPSGWPYPLRLAADIVLGTPAPMLLVWGSDRVVILNDAYAALASSRSARAPGGSVPPLWPAPLSAARTALEQACRGQASVAHAQKIPFIRDSGVELLDFDLHFVPLLDEAGQPQGALCTLAAPSPAVQPVAEELRILVVEDNLDSQYLVCEMLRAFGHQVEGVSHAEDALALLGTQTFDVLFSDVSLPGMSGVELARTALQRQPGLQVIFASGYGDSLLRQLDFPYTSLQKPYELDQLQAALTRTRERIARAR